MSVTLHDRLLEFGLSHHATDQRIPFRCETGQAPAGYGCSRIARDGADKGGLNEEEISHFGIQRGRGNGQRGCEVRVVPEDLDICGIDIIIFLAETSPRSFSSFSNNHGSPPPASLIRRVYEPQRLPYSPPSISTPVTRKTRDPLRLLLFVPLIRSLRDLITLRFIPIPKTSTLIPSLPWSTPRSLWYRATTLQKKRKNVPSVSNPSPSAFVFLERSHISCLSVAMPSTRLALPLFMDQFRGRAVPLQFCANRT
ncbi:hypothetical protein EDB86DRAFT_682052 [Lactarius hatsudake]|nr:hypothetical protein EDB86DRAFT_682052 [Lactarius hatsudake]